MMELHGGPFTTAHAWAAGFSTPDIRRLVRRGEWIGLRRGVYAAAPVVAEAARDPARRHALEVAALLLVLECDVVAGGTSAAQIWGLDLLERPPRQLVVVTDDADAIARRRAGYALRTAALRAGHRAVRHGVPVTAAARTVVDLARTSTVAAGVVVADSALRMRVTDRRELADLLVDCEGWPGIARATRAVTFADDRSESVLESVSRVAMHQEGIVPSRTQVTIGDDRVDFLWDDVGDIGEADGLAKYEADGRRTTRDIVRAEKRREERLADAGFEVIRWGWEDAHNPPRLARRLRAAFARGAERQRGRRAACALPSPGSQQNRA